MAARNPDMLMDTCPVSPTHPTFPVSSPHPHSPPPHTFTHHYLQAAHIGCGISGREGRAAVLASDFSFAQFRCERGDGVQRRIARACMGAGDGGGRGGGSREEVYPTQSVITPPSHAGTCPACCWCTADPATSATPRSSSTASIRTG